MNYQSKLSNTPHAESSPPPATHDPALIQQALDDIFRSTPFRTTKQCQDLLRYVVKNTLAGLDQLLRERVIGAEVFGRKPDYDTGDDPVVRLRAAEVRKRLAQYYQGANRSSYVRIDIPSGSYRATFEWISPAEPQALSVTSPAELTVGAALAKPAPPSPPSELDHEIRTVSRQKVAWAMSALLLLLVAVAVSMRISRSNQEPAFRQFWAPIIIGSKPVIICMGSNAVYRLSSDFMVRYLAERHLENHGLDFFVDLQPDQSVQSRDLQPAYSSFVALGDVAAVSDIVAALTLQGKPYQQRFPPDISFAELQNTPTITVGGFNNPLTLTLTKDLRFTLAESSRVIDNQNSGKVWAVKFNGDSHDTEDYGVVSRLIDSKTGGPVISIAGIGQYGTQAAAEFISNPQRIAALAQSAPRGWNQKNMQIVLHIKIVDYRPIATDVVATHYW